MNFGLLNLLYNGIRRKSSLARENWVLQRVFSGSLQLYQRRLRVASWRLYGSSHFGGDSRRRPHLKPAAPAIDADWVDVFAKSPSPEQMPMHILHACRLVFHGRRRLGALGGIGKLGGEFADLNTLPEGHSSFLPPPLGSFEPNP